MAEEEVIEIDLAQLKKMKVQELRKQASELGLETKGTKAELLARVEKYLKEQEEDLLEEEVEEEEELEEGEEEEEGKEEGKEGVGNAGEQSQTQAEQEPSTRDQSRAAESSTATSPKASEGAPPQQKMVKLEGGSLTPEERVRKRTERFGVNSSEQTKRMARAQRFGTSVGNGVKGQKGATLSSEDMERMQKRAERFGMVVAPSLTAVEEDQKKEKRRERFGMTTAELPLDDRKRKRLERFGAS